MTQDQNPRLLSGGNPQIAKGDGDAPVQAYIAAMPGWKQGAGQQIDALITRIVPDVKKAIKWNSPFYGIADQGWFLSFPCTNRYIKLGFFRGADLSPLPPEASKSPDVRYVHIFQDGIEDEALLADWIAQAALLPGWMA